MRYLAIIPARSGSKGILNKNITIIKQKPLIGFTIEPALEARAKGLLNEVIVSTDSEKYAEIAKSYGAHVPFLRPIEISDDRAKSVEFIIHAVEFFEANNQFFDAVVLLQPTSPLRTFSDIEDSISLFESKFYLSPSLVSVYKEDHVNEFSTYEKNSDGFGIGLSAKHNKGIRRQEIPDRFVRNGAIYITSVAYLKDARQVISDLPTLFEMPKTDR